MTSQELLTSLENAVSCPDQAYASKMVHTLLRYAYNHNLNVLCPTQWDAQSPDYAHCLYLTNGGYRQFIVFTSAARFHRLDPWPDGVGLTPVPFKLFLDGIVQRPDFCGLAINPYKDEAGMLHAGFPVEMRGTGLTQNGAKGWKNLDSDT